MFNTGRFYYCGLKEAIDVHGDERKAKMFLGLIRKDYETKEKRRLLQAQLTKEQWQDLKRLVAIMKSGKVEAEFVWADKLDIDKTAKRKLPYRERKTTMMILKNRKPLQEVLGIRELREVKPEEDFEEFGRSDLFVTGDRIGFPIELKDETSNERLSGQIFKYVKGAIRLIKQGRYDTVQGVVIAPGYSQEAVNQLKSYNIWVLQIHVDKENYRLERIS